MKKPQRTKRMISCLLAFCVLGAALLCTSCGKQQGRIETLAQLNGKCIVSEQGNIYAQEACEDERLKNSTAVTASSSTDAVAMLLSGNAEAYAVDYPVALFYAYRNPTLTILEEKLMDSPLGFAFPEGSPLREEFADAIQALWAAGKEEELQDKWFGTEGDFSVSAQNWTGNRGTIHCLINPEYEPICFLSGDGAYIGYEIDLLLLCAEYLDYHITFTSTDFDNVLPAVAAGEFDMGAGGISFTEERDGLVDFATYMDAAGVVFLVSGEEKSDWSAFLSGAVLMFTNASYRSMLWKGFGLTILLTLSSLALGFLFGSGMALWEYLGGKRVKAIFGKFHSVMELLPESTCLLICYYILFPASVIGGVLACILDLTLIFTHYCASGWLSALAGVDPLQEETARLMGFSKKQTLFTVLLPQALPGFVSGIKMDIIFQLRSTTVVEIVGVMDFTGMIDTIRAETGSPYLPLLVTAVFYALFSMLLRAVCVRIPIPTGRSEAHQKALRQQIAQCGKEDAQ